MKSHRLSILIIIFCTLLFILLAAIAVWSNATAVELFGKPDDRIGLLQQISLSAKLILNRESILANPQSDIPEMKFTIDFAESATSVCKRLEAEGLVLSGELTCAYLTYSGLDRELQAGTFTVQTDKNAIEVAQTISNPRARDIQLTIFAGWRIEEIGAAVDGLGLEFDGHDFVNFAYDPPDHVLQTLGLPEGASLEGYLLPGSYSLPPDVSLNTLFASVLTQFVLKMQTEDIVSGLKDQQLSYQEGLTLASIIERETAQDLEKPLMASVFFNRLSEGMGLETDPTVQYACGYNSDQKTWWRHPLSMTDLACDSVYNTYQVAGLPPGPICNPSLSSLKAVAFPEVSDYFYFRAKCDGSGTHNFAKTYQEHLNNACE